MIIRMNESHFLKRKPIICYNKTIMKNQIMNANTAKNSLIELLRFVMAWSVLIFHGFMPVKTTILDMGVTCVSVDFFLMLGGFLFASSYTHMAEEKTGRGI